MCMGRTHMASAAAGWLGIAAWSGQHPGPALACAAVAAAGALTPDLDHPNSLIAHRLHIRWLCRGVARLSGGHRHGTHSALFVAALWWVAATAHVPLWASVRLGLPAGVPAYRAAPVIALAFAVGVAAHIVGDCLTPEGCPILWPMRHRFSLHLFTTNTRRETAFAVLCVIGGLFAARHVGIVPAGPWDHPSTIWSTT